MSRKRRRPLLPDDAHFHEKADPCQALFLIVSTGQNERLSMVVLALVGQFEFPEWTPGCHLRHARFDRLDDKGSKDVQR